jgi:hypothetical protein
MTASPPQPASGPERSDRTARPHGAAARAQGEPQKDLNEEGDEQPRLVPASDVIHASPGTPVEPCPFPCSICYRKGRQGSEEPLSLAELRKRFEDLDNRVRRHLGQERGSHG